jgi:hypothetical protein
MRPRCPARPSISVSPPRRPLNLSNRGHVGHSRHARGSSGVSAERVARSHTDHAGPLTVDRLPPRAHLRLPDPRRRTTRLHLAGRRAGRVGPAVGMRRRPSHKSCRCPDRGRQREHAVLAATPGALAVGRCCFSRRCGGGSSAVRMNYHHYGPVRQDGLTAGAACLPGYWVQGTGQHEERSASWVPTTRSRTPPRT